MVVPMAKNQKKGEAEWEKGEERTYATVVQKFENAGDAIESVERMGGADSTVSDVKITTAGGVFYVESKMPNSFAGQFTVTKKGNPSQRNLKGDKLKAAKAMTANKDMLLNDPSSPESQEILANYMQANYEAKNAPFICVDYGEGQVLVPLEEAMEAFDFELDFREEGKLSGTSKISKKNETIIGDLLAEAGLPAATRGPNDKYHSLPDEAFGEDGKLPEPMKFTDASGVERYIVFTRDRVTGQVLVKQRGTTKTQTMLVKIHRKDPIPEDKIHEWEDMFYDYAENVANGGGSSPNVTTSVTRAADPTESTRRNAARIKDGESAKPAAGSESEEWVWVGDHYRMGHPVHGYHRRRRASDAPYRG